jgi:CheY-like chemotaxis protein
VAEQGALKARVLVVDDEPNVRTILCNYLRDAEYDTLEACNGAEAVDAALRTRPEIVLMDVTMPEMDGLAACTRIKTEPRLASTQIIICTARSARQDLIEAIKAGADDYIIKPFQRDMVLTKVERARERGQTPRPFLSPVGSERRTAPRKPVTWSVTWEASTCQSAFKCRVIDVSMRGIAFEFPGCKVCTIGEGSQLLPHWPPGQVVDFILAISRDVLLEVKGTVAYATPIAGRREMEKVGVEFRELPPHVASLITDYVDGKLKL